MRERLLLRIDSIHVKLYSLTYILQPNRCLTALPEGNIVIVLWEGLSLLPLSIPKVHKIYLSCTGLLYSGSENRAKDKKGHCKTGDGCGMIVIEKCDMGW